jgi:hypothetical protein
VFNEYIKHDTNEYRIMPVGYYRQVTAKNKC